MRSYELPLAKRQGTVGWLPLTSANATVTPVPHHVGATRTLVAPTPRSALDQDESAGPPLRNRLGPEPSRWTTCPTCGFTAGTLSSDGLFVAVVSIPGEYRELLAQFGSVAELDEILRHRRDELSLSALEHIAYVSNSLHAWATRAAAILMDGRDRLPPIHVDAHSSDANAAPTPALLASLQAGTTDLARTVSHCGVDAWARSAQLDGQCVTVRDLLDAALHDALHHLTAVESILENHAEM